MAFARAPLHDFYIVDGFGRGAQQTQGNQDLMRPAPISVHDVEIMKRAQVWMTYI